MENVGRPVSVAWLGCIAALGALIFASGTGQAVLRPLKGAKLSARLTLLSEAPLVGATPARQSAALSLPLTGGGSLIRDGRLLKVYIRVADTSTETRTGLIVAGLRITLVATTASTVSGYVEARRLKRLALAPGVRAITEALRPLTNAGPATTWG